MTSQILTVPEVRAWFSRCGISIAEWAQSNGFASATVYALLAGRCRGHRGEAHRAAVALGLKLGATDDDHFLMQSHARASQPDCHHGENSP